MKIVALIPARGGSKRIPKKNIKRLNGKPLISYMIKAAKLSIVDEVWVSTDDEQIKYVAIKEGAKVVMRPSSISGDGSSTEEAIEHFSTFVDYNIIVLLEATYPLTNVDDINGALIKFNSGDYDSLLSLQSTPMWIWHKENSELVQPDFRTENRPMSQDFETYIETGGIFITTKKAFETSHLRVSGRIGFYEVPHLSIDIDTPREFKLVELILKNSFK